MDMSVTKSTRLLAFTFCVHGRMFCIGWLGIWIGAIWRVILGDSFADDERLEELEKVLALDMLDSDDHVSHDG